MNHIRDCALWLEARHYISDDISRYTEEWWRAYYDLLKPSSMIKNDRFLRWYVKSALRSEIDDGLFETYLRAAKFGYLQSEWPNSERVWRSFVRLGLSPQVSWACMMCCVHHGRIEETILHALALDGVDARSEGAYVDCCRIISAARERAYAKDESNDHNLLRSADIIEEV